MMFRTMCNWFVDWGRKVVANVLEGTHEVLAVMTSGGGGDSVAKARGWVGRSALAQRSSAPAVGGNRAGPEGFMPIGQTGAHYFGVGNGAVEGVNEFLRRGTRILTG